MGIKIKNIKLEPAVGGYIIKYDCYKKQEGDYDGMRYIGEKKIVQEDGKKALAMVDELFEASMSKPHHHDKDDEYGEDE
jgi:hypothetical protein